MGAWCERFLGETVFTVASPDRATADCRIQAVAAAGSPLNRSRSWCCAENAVAPVCSTR